MKLCKKCNSLKNISEFSRNKKNKDGLQDACKFCTKDYNTKYYLKNKEKIISNSASYYYKNKDEILLKQIIYRRNNINMLRELYKVNRNKNKEKISSYLVIYYKKNKIKLIENMRIYREINKVTLYAKKSIYGKTIRGIETRRQGGRTRRALNKNAQGSHSKDDIKRILVLQKHRCACCKSNIKEGYHVDHINALSNGGSNGCENLQILCPKCNLSKSAKCPIKFMQERGYLL